MRTGYYFGLAKEGIRKNKRLYFPYLFTCMGMVMMCYILSALSENPNMSTFKGGGEIGFFLHLGTYIIVVFSAFFLFYSHSFLIRRRKKEFGLYSVLGMGRRDLAKILLWENLISTGVALGGGLVFGILFSKLAEVGLLNVLDREINLKLWVSTQSILSTTVEYLIVFFLIFLNALRQIRFASVISLLGSEKSGEKPPKGNWFLAIAGLGILVFAYYIAVTIKDPIAAVMLFFAASIMVIVATYLLMIAGSVFFCRLLQKNKKYYYKTKHFISVSSMVYRMKRNGAGLATICILATMILVMISSTSCLYLGNEDALRYRYPKEINVMMYADSQEILGEGNYQQTLDVLRRLAVDNGAQITEENCFRCGIVSGVKKGNSIQTDVEEYGSRTLGELNNMVLIYFIPIADFNKENGVSIELEKDEIAIYGSGLTFPEDELNYADAKTFRIKHRLTAEEMGISEALQSSFVDEDIIQTIYIFVSDLEEGLGNLTDRVNATGDKEIQFSLGFSFDTGLSKSEQVTFLHNYKDAYLRQEFPVMRSYVEGREYLRSDFFVTFGGLFYLGIMLSIVFTIAAVLIIYYKQISEGYEDQNRFDIMQKVGMTQKEIKSSINSQMLTVFFFPLTLAGIHICFAFPIIHKLLILFGLDNVTLFAITSFISFLLFGLMYLGVYKITSNAYYRIVSHMMNE